MTIGETLFCIAMLIIIVTIITVCNRIYNHSPDFTAGHNKKNNKKVNLPLEK